MTCTCMCVLLTFDVQVQHVAVVQETHTLEDLLKVIQRLIVRQGEGPVALVNQHLCKIPVWVGEGVREDAKTDGNC